MGSITNTSFDSSNFELKPSTIQNVVSSSSKELAGSLLCVAVAAPFVSQPAGIALFVAAAVSCVAVNTLIRAVGDCISASLSANRDPNVQRTLKIASAIYGYVAPLLLSPLILASAHLLVHEAGHFLAAKLLFSNAAPKITITAFGDGLTSYAYAPLSALGRRLGIARSYLLISAAGPAASVLASSLSTCLSHCVRKSYPNLRRYLLVAAIINLASELLYALEPLTKSNLPSSHDYAYLKAGGIHPLASAATIVALPLVAFLLTSVSLRKSDSH
jgi:hypothetical protein